MSVFAMWGRKAAQKVIERELPKMIEAEFKRQIGQQIPSIMRDIFREKPNMQLTEAGFNWALYLHLQNIWPEVDKKEAVRWLMEYIEVPYGHKDYDWSASSAKMIAIDYANEMGEIA